MGTPPRQRGFSSRLHGVAEKLGFGEIDRVAVEVMAEGESGVDLIRELIRPERF